MMRATVVSSERLALKSRPCIEWRGAQPRLPWTTSVGQRALVPLTYPGFA